MCSIAGTIPSLLIFSFHEQTDKLALSFPLLKKRHNLQNYICSNHNLVILCMVYEQLGTSFYDKNFTTSIIGSKLYVTPGQKRAN